MFDEGHCGWNETLDIRENWSADKKASRPQPCTSVTCGAVHFENIIRFSWKFIATDIERMATQRKAVCFLWHCWHANDSPPPHRLSPLSPTRFGSRWNRNEVNFWMPSKIESKSWDFNFLMRNADVAAVCCAISAINSPLPHQPILCVCGCWAFDSVSCLLLRSLLFHQTSK